MKKIKEHKLNNLRTLRKAKFVNQKKVADYLGISIAAYGNYELGLRYPDIDMLCRLADYYEISVDMLLGRDTEKAISPIAQEIAEIFDKLNMEDKNKVLSYIEFLANKETKTINEEEEKQKQLLYKIGKY